MSPEEKMKNPNKTNIITYDLDIITTHVRKIIEKRGCNDVFFNLMVNDALTQLEMVFWKEYIGKQQLKKIFVYTPETWIQHFKETHCQNRLMSWWLKKHPIKMKETTYKISKIHIFPEVKVPKKREFKTKIVYKEVFTDDT